MQHCDAANAGQLPRKCGHVIIERGSAWLSELQNWAISIFWGYTATLNGY